MKPSLVPFRTPADLPAAAAAVREALDAGEPFAVPTETFYGLAVGPADHSAVERVFRAKGRESAKALPVLVASLAQAATLVDVPERWRSVLASIWPAPLTVVLPTVRPLAAGRATLAVRVTAHPLTRVLLARVGPLTATSANRSGEPPALTADEAAAFLGSSVAMVLDGGACRGGAPSTLVDLTGAVPKLLRAGAWSVPADWI